MLRASTSSSSMVMISLRVDDVGIIGSLTLDRGPLRVRTAKASSPPTGALAEVVVLVALIAVAAVVVALER